MAGGMATFVTEHNVSLEPSDIPPIGEQPDYSPEALERLVLEREDALPPIISIASKQPVAKPTKQWEAPAPLVDDHLSPVPPFDINLLPIDLRGWVQDITDRMQVAPDLVAVAAMCALGVAAANARTIHPKRNDNWRVWTNLWGAVVAPAGSMKSPAAAAVERTLSKLEEQAREEHERQMFDAQADLMISQASQKALKSKLESAAKGRKNTEHVERDEIIKLLRQTAEEQETRPRLRRIKASDATIEALIDRAHRGKRRCQPIIVWRDELVGLLSSFDRDGHESDRKILMEAWSVSSITVDRMSRGTIFAKDFAVSMFGCVTPGAFGTYVREATTAGAGADGFLQRLQLLVYPDAPATWSYVDRSPDRMAERRARALYERLFALDEDDEHDKPPALHFDSDAQEFFEQWLTVLEARLRDPRKGWDDEARRSHFAKYRSLMPALALLCHLAAGHGADDIDVTLEAADRAARWCDYLEAHAERVYAMRDRSIESLMIEKIKSGKLKNSVSIRDLKRRFLQDHRADLVHEACAELERLGWLRVGLDKPNVGRPSPIVTINPKAGPT
jgi:hypothetical protein